MSFVWDGDSYFLVQWVFRAQASLTTIFLVLKYCKWNLAWHLIWLYNFRNMHVTFVLSRSSSLLLLTTRTVIQFFFLNKNKAILGYKGESQMVLLIHTNKFYWDFAGGASGKELTWQSGRHKRCGFNPQVRKIPRRKSRQPMTCLEKSRGQRSLRLQSIGSQRVGHDRSDLAHTNTNF